MEESAGTCSDDFFVSSTTSGSSPALAPTSCTAEGETLLEPGIAVELTALGGETFSTGRFDLPGCFCELGGCLVVREGSSLPVEEGEMLSASADSA